MLNYSVVQIQAPSECAIVTRVNILEAAWTRAPITRVTACTATPALVARKVSVFLVFNR